MKKIAKPVLYKDFLEHITKEQKELDESMKESFKQRDERKKNRIRKITTGIRTNR